MPKITFTKKNNLCFIASIALLTAGFACMATDPVPNGFGLLTLWIAPPLLLIGLAMPVLGILGIENVSFSGFAATLQKNKWKHTGALMVLLFSFFIYFITLEPTASLWDCSEFIASAYKLQVPHTPGTPLSLLIARVFAAFSFGDVHQVAWSINLMSGAFSSLAVFLVYHTIYYFGERILAISGKRAIPLIFASTGGSLCLAFSDSFWFSAVEAETYGVASFFLMLTLCLILKGNHAGEPLKSRYLILIAYILGLSYCIHPMCVLVVPVLTFAWYANNKALSVKQAILSVLSGLTIVLIINRVVAVGIFEWAFSFDLFFVNNLHLPFYSGALLFFVTTVITFALLLKKIPRHATFIWSVIFLLFGFTPYLLLFIRSNHNPPIDEGNPENLQLIKAYMNREGYPSSPLVYGPYFDARIENIKGKKKVFFKDDSAYKIAGSIQEYNYEDSRETILPRLYSRNEDHIQVYRQWTGLKPNEKPKFYDNLKFMFSYQIGHMYLRYLMWNFAGRESDTMHSPWLKPWKKLSTYDSTNKTRNQYWMLPFLSGLLGMICQYGKDKKSFFSNIIFFLVTGIVLVVYLNSPPNEPRERDYIYVGSYIAFSIWVGLGILAIWQMHLRSNIRLTIIVLISLGLPLWMLCQNFDDHDRSNRTFQIDHARMVLNSCAPGSILFTGGDNDTFPLWYLQEVEGYKTDVRVVVLSYFNTDWYINQLRKQYYRSPPFRLTLDPGDYRQYGPNDVLYVKESIKNGIDVRKFIQLLKEDNAALKMYTDKEDPYHILPSRKLKLKITSENIFTDKAVPANQAHELSAEFTFLVKENYLEKNALAVLDLIMSNGLERPLYFNFTSANTFGLDLSPYLIQEGEVYRLSGIKEKANRINKELMYQNLIEKADFTNLSDKRVNFSYEDHFARIIVPLRQSFNDLAEAYLQEGDNEAAEKVLQHALEKLYHKHLRPSFSDLQTASLLLYIGKSDRSKNLTLSVFDHYYNKAIENENSISQPDFYILRKAAELMIRMGETKYADKITALHVAGTK